MRGYKLRKSWPPPSDLCKYSKFQKTDNTRRSTGPRSKNPKIAGPNDEPRATTHLQKVWKFLPQRTRATTHLHFNSRAHTRRKILTRSHAPHSSMTSWWRHLPLLAWPGSLDPTRFGDPSESPKKKCFDQVWPLTLTKKSKFSKNACPTQFFVYILILESVSLFKTWKLCKLSNFQKFDFYTNLDQKVKFSRITCLA